MDKSNGTPPPAAAFSGDQHLALPAAPLFPGNRFFPFLVPVVFSPTAFRRKVAVAHFHQLFSSTVLARSPPLPAAQSPPVLPSPMSYFGISLIYITMRVKYVNVLDHREQDAAHPPARGFSRRPTPQLPAPARVLASASANAPATGDRAPSLPAI